MRKVVVLTILIVLVFPLVSAVSNYSTYEHGFALFQNFSTTTAQVGMWIETKNSEVWVDGIVLNESDDSTRCIIETATGINVTEGTRIGDYCQFSTAPYMLSANTCYAIKVDNNGSQYSPWRYDGGSGTNYVTDTPYFEYDGDYRFNLGTCGVGIGTAGSNVNDYYSYHSINLSNTDPSSILVTLNQPSNDEVVSSSELELNVSYDLSSLSGYDSSNITFSVWYSNGTLFNESLRLTSGVINSSTLNITGLEQGQYHYNAEVCGTDGITSECDIANNNNSFTFGYILNNLSFSRFVVEGQSNTISLNVSTTGGASITNSVLNYDSDSYSTIITNTAPDEFLIQTNIIAPQVSTDTNFSFNHTLTFSTGGVVITSTEQQSVTDISIDDCSVNTLLILNYTGYDEESQTRLNDLNIQVDLDISGLGTTTPVIEYSANKTGEHSVCLPAGTLDSANYRLDSQVLYERSNYSSEYHHIQNTTLSTSTTHQNISLYPLLLDDSTEFLITFKDASFIPVEDALIDITRKYVSEGVFRSVEIPKTDENGQAQAHFDTSGVVYTMVVSKNGAVLATFDEVTVSCQNPTLEDCELNLNAFTSTTPLQDFESVGGITYTLSFDQSTRTITLVFTSTDGSSQNVLLNASVFDAYLNQTACTDTLTSSSGTLTCVIPTTVGNTTILAEVYSGGLFITQSLYNLQQSASEVFGQTGIILVIIMYSMIPLMFVTSPIGMVIGAIIGIVMAVMLNLLDTGSVLGVGSTIGWLIISGAILIWRISKIRGGQV